MTNTSANTAAPQPLIDRPFIWRHWLLIAGGVLLTVLVAVGAVFALHDMMTAPALQPIPGSTQTNVWAEHWARMDHAALGFSPASSHGYGHASFSPTGRQ